MAAAVAVVWFAAHRMEPAKTKQYNIRFMISS
jgi:hypothetical protein